MVLVVPIIIALSLFFFAGLVLWKNSKELTNRLFSALVISIAAWVILLVISDLHLPHEINIVTNRLIMAIGVPSSQIFFHFARNFPNRRKKHNKHLILALTVVSMLAFSVTLFTPLIVSGVTEYEQGVNPDLSKLYPFLLVYNASLLITGLFVLIRKFRNSSGLERYQILYMLAGFIAFLIVVIPLNLIIPLATGNTITARYGTIGAIVWSAFITYSIVNHRLLDLKILLEKVATGLAAGILGTTIYSAILYINNLLFDDIWSIPTLVTNFLLISIITIIFIPLREYFSSNVISQIFKTKYLQDKWFNFEKRFTRYIEQPKLANSLIEFLHYKGGYNKVVLAIYKKDSKNIIYTSKDIKKNQIKDENLLQQGEDFNLDPSKLYYFPEFSNKNSQIMKFMEKNDLKLAASLFGQKRKNIVGLFFLGSKVNKSPYTTEDFSTLKDIKNSLENALARSVLYEMLENFNQTLQQKVNEATKELKKRNAELQTLYDNLEELYQKEKDLMDIAGHELRTPASILKNNLYLLKNRLNQVYPKNTEDDKLQKYIDRLRESTERQIRLVNTFLESARIENKKFNLNLEQADFAAMVNRAVEETIPFAEKKGLEIIYEPINKKMFVELDSTRIREVLDNLLNNAVKYTNDGYIKVDVKEDEDTVSFYVKDSGIGISQEDKKFLFKKFSRVETHIGGDDENLVRPGGTGLGLYVAKNIIDYHKGNIGVESEVGKGSTFYFKIPKKQPGQEVSESPFAKFTQTVNK